MYHNNSDTMETNDTISSCSVSKDQEIQRLQEKARLLKGGFMKGLKVLQSNFKILSDDLKDFDRLQNYTALKAHSVKDTIINDMDIIKKYLLETILHEQEIQELQFYQFIDSQFSLDYDSQMTDKYFVEYTGIEVKQFRETLLQHMSNVKKFVIERTRHQRQYDRRVNKRQMQTQESKVDTDKALDIGLVVTKSSGTELEVQDTSSRSGNDTDTNDADIRPIYDEEPMAEAQLTAECNVFATGQHHTEQHEFNNEGGVDQYTEQCQVKSPMLNPSLDNKITEFSNQSLKSENVKSYKTGKRNKPVEQKSHTQKPVRQIFTRHIFSPNKSFAVYEKTSPRSCLRWKPTGRIFKYVGLRWVPTGNTFASCTSKVDFEPSHGSGVDISKIHECKQTLDLSAGTSINVQKEQSIDFSAGISYNVKKDNLRVWLLKKLISQKLVL
ncbi:hypothetical protein Tco_0127373 [Tanacetum coccineum]